jgi:hypothetical protein
MTQYGYARLNQRATYLGLLVTALLMTWHPSSADQAPPHAIKWNQTNLDRDSSPQHGHQKVHAMETRTAERLGCQLEAARGHTSARHC